MNETCDGDIGLLTRQRQRPLPPLFLNPHRYVPTTVVVNAVLPPPSPDRAG